MPLNEAFRRSNLTKEQKRQAELALYGLPDSNMNTPNNDQPTFEEVEAMRRFIQKHDAQNKPQEFDLNNPPRKPYVYQAFPKIIYKGDAHKEVRNAQERDAYYAQGWHDKGFGLEADVEAVPVPEPVQTRRK